MNTPGTNMPSQHLCDVAGCLKQALLSFDTNRTMTRLCLQHANESTWDDEVKSPHEWVQKKNAVITQSVAGAGFSKVSIPEQPAAAGLVVGGLSQLVGTTQAIANELAQALAERIVADFREEA